MFAFQLTDLIGRIGPVRLMQEAGAAVAEHAAEGGHEAAHELPNLITLITHFMADGPVELQGRLYLSNYAVLVAEGGR